MHVTHSLLFGFNSVLALCQISVWYFRAVLAGCVSGELTSLCNNNNRYVILDAHVAKIGLSDQ
jgi:hypothetical protein